jgi:G3E family GTPase
VSAERAPVGRIPVTLLTGFLGAGKTTLLNYWVQQPALAGAAVLVNEFGEVGIDHHLVDTLDDQMVLLDSGCVCCSVRGDLVGALKSLAARSARRDIAPITRVVIETSGLADPVPIWPSRTVTASSPWCQPATAQSKCACFPRRCARSWPPTCC